MRSKHADSTPERDNWTPVGDDGRVDWSAPELLNDDRLVQLRVYAEDFVPYVGPWLELTDDADLDAGTIRLARGESISGVVVDETGAPVNAVEVRVVPEADDVPEDWGVAVDDYAESTSDGRFVYCGLAPGRYRLRCDFDGAPAAVTLPAGTSDAVIVVQRSTVPRPVKIGVRAVDATGGPALGPLSMRVSTLDRHCSVSSSCDADRVSWASIRAAGPVSLRVTSEATGELVVLGLIESSDEPYVVTFGTGTSTTIRGRVVADPGAVPVEKRSLHAYASQASEDGQWSGSVHVGKDGRFSIVAPGAGPFVVTVEDDYWVNGRSSEFCNEPFGLTVAEAGAEEVIVRLPAPETLQLVAGLSNGAEPDDCDWYFDVVDDAREYEIHRWDWSPELRGFRVERLPAGRTWTLTVRALVEEGHEYFGPVVLSGVRTGGGPVFVTLGRSLAVEGVVMRRDGSPVVRATVEIASDTDPFDDSYETGLDGRFRFTGLSPGEWKLTAESNGLATPEPIVVVAGSTGVRVVASPRKASF